jgi:NTE family protein
MARTAFFVLSGGASLGAAQAGMLAALFEREIRPDLVVGTSVGALHAAFVASRPPTPATATELAQIWRRLHRDQVFPLSLRGLVGGLTKRHDYLVRDSGLRRIVEAHLQFERLEEAEVALLLVAFDVVSGCEVRLSSGPAVEAVLAAAAIPGILPPVHWGEARLIDGGVVNNTPISHAVELGAERVYVLPPGNSRRVSPNDFGHADQLIDEASRRRAARSTSPISRGRWPHEPQAPDETEARWIGHLGGT